MTALQLISSLCPSLLLHSLTGLFSKGTPTPLLPANLHLGICFLEPQPKISALLLRARLEGAGFCPEGQGGEEGWQQLKPVRDRSDFHCRKILLEDKLE